MKVQKRDGVTILVTDERLDSLDGPKLRDVVKQLLAQEPCLKLVIDMEKTLFLDSSGCGGLVSSLKTLMNNHGDMKIAGPTPKVLEIFQLTRLHRVFEIHDSVESAVESFNLSSTPSSFPNEP
ncbi:MAG: STAS domain-containing protein [Desulfomonilaceae bacterium]